MNTDGNLAGLETYMDSVKEAEQNEEAFRECVQHIVDDIELSLSIISATALTYGLDIDPIEHVRENI